MKACQQQRVQQYAAFNASFRCFLETKDEAPYRLGPALRAFACQCSCALGRMCRQMAAALIHLPLHESDWERSGARL